MKVLPGLKLFVFFLLNLFGYHSFSQAGFTHIPAPGGSWGPGTISITQDPKGYMWFGAIGLHRYDGYSYKSYFNDPLDSSSLGFNRILCIFADSNGFIWVGTNGGGLDRLDPERGTFTHFRHDPADTTSISSDLISAILEDRQGMVWVGTEKDGGLNCLDPITGNITRYKHNPNDSNSLSHDEVRALYEDRNGTLWIGTGFPYTGDEKWKKGGLNRFNPIDKNFTRFLHDPNDESSLIDNRIGDIYEDSKGAFWVGTAGDGLHTMDRKKGTFVRHTNNAHSNDLSRPPVRNTVAWADDFITFIREDVSGTFWIGTSSGGLNTYDPETGQIEYYPSLQENSIDKNQISGVSWSFTSKDGVLWVSGADGVFRMDPLHKLIPHHDIGQPVRSILQDDTGELWLGTDQGIVVYDSSRRNKKRFVHAKSDTESLSDNRVLSIFKDRKGIIWIGTAIGLNRFDQKTQNFTRYFLVPSSNHLNQIHSIYEDRTESLWIGSYRSLSSMNRQDAAFTFYGQNQFDTIQNNLSTMLENKDGYLWIGTWSGLKRLDKATNIMEHYLPGFSIRSVFEDTDGILWVGTNRGLYYSKPSNNDFVLFMNPGAGLTENINVFHILEDDQGSLWINTNTGIFRLRHNRSEISLFGKSRMIPTIDGTQNNCFKGIGGELFFGDYSSNGYYAFFPEQLKTNTIAPDLHITGFRLGDQLVVPGKGSSLNEHLSHVEEINLSYDENVFSFEFAGIHYSSPEDNRHLFMLENFNNTWQKAGEEKTANYFNVPPGHYIFRVKAANSDGVWAEKSIAIIISPPWWKTGWAYFMYGVLFIAGVLGTHRVQKARVIKAERERTRKKELAQAKEIEKAYHELKTTQAQLVQREKMASLGELTAGIAHEIQNPLNFVNNFSEVNKELLEEMKEEIDKGNLEDAKAIARDVIVNEGKITHHGKRADGIVKGMLQHSHSGSGVKEPTNINALAEEYLRLAYHGFRAKDKSFNAMMKTDFDETIGNINIIPQDIGRVILNLINNAFYAVTEKKKQLTDGYEPTVSVSTNKTGDKILILVKDNGNGIHPKISDKIFQPFFTTKPTGQGTGLGLSLSYDIVKAHGGELKVKTVEGDGAEFIIQLPYN